MVVPSHPVSYFVVGHPGFAFPALNTFFDAVFCLGNATEFEETDPLGRIAQVVVCFHDVTISIPITNDHQDFFHCVATASGLHTSLQRFDNKGSLFSIANVDSSPRMIRLL